MATYVYPAISNLSFGGPSYSVKDAQAYHIGDVLDPGTNTATTVGTSADPFAAVYATDYYWAGVKETTVPTAAAATSYSIATTIGSGSDTALATTSAVKAFASQAGSLVVSTSTASTTPYYLMGVSTLTSASSQTVYDYAGAYILAGQLYSGGSLVGTEDEYVKNMLHLGYYDTYTKDSNGNYVVTRQTGYISSDDLDLQTIQSSGTTPYPNWYCRFKNNILVPANLGTSNPIILNDHTGIVISFLDSHNGYLFQLNLTTNYSTADEVKSFFQGKYAQYKLASSYTETYDPNHFARIQPYALEYAKSEADRSSNLCDNATFLDGVTSFHCCSANYSNGQLNLVSAGEDSYIGEFAISPYNPKYGKRINVKPDTTYTLSTGSSDINKNFITLYDSNGTKVSSIWSNGTNIATFTTPSTCAFITIRVGYGSSVAGTTYPFNIMLNEGSHPLPYQPYEGPVAHLGSTQTWTAAQNLGTGTTINGATIVTSLTISYDSSTQTLTLF